jgi:hypothetical protein
MNTTLSPVTVQRFSALQGELIGLVEQDYAGLSPKLEQIIRAFEFTQIEQTKQSKGAVFKNNASRTRLHSIGQPRLEFCKRPHRIKIIAPDSSPRC